MVWLFLRGSGSEYCELRPMSGHPTSCVRLTLGGGGLLDYLLTSAKLKYPFGVLDYRLIGPPRVGVSGVASTVSQSVPGFCCSLQLHKFAHLVIPMTMDDFLSFLSFWKQHGKVPSFQLLVTHDYAGEEQTKNKDPSGVESTVGHVFNTG